MRTHPAALCAVVALAGCTGCNSCDGDRPTSPPARSSALARPPQQELPKLTCDETQPVTKKAGNVLGCQVTTDVKVGPITCAKGARVELFDDGKLRECTLARAHAYDGVPCAAGLSGKWYESGKLAECGIDLPYERSGVTCRGRIALQENGKVDRCQLDKDVKLGSIEAPAESWLTLDAQGRPARVQRPEDQPYQLATIPCGEVHYYPSGRVKICVTTERVIYRAKPLPPKTRLCFDEQGEPSQAVAESCFAPPPR